MLSPSASASAFRIAAHPPPTGGSPQPRAPTGVSGSGMFSAFHCHIYRNIQNRRRPVLVKALGDGNAILRVDHPLLPDGVADAQRRTSEDLAAQRRWMKHRAHIGIGQIIDDVVLARLHIDFHFGKTGQIGIGIAIMRILVFRRSHQTLAGQSSYRLLGCFMHVGIHIVAIVDAAQFDGVLRRLAQSSSPRRRPCGSLAG